VSDNSNLDPEIAELLGISTEEETAEPEVDFGFDASKPIPKTELKQINMDKVLDNKNYYPKIISSAGEHGRRLHDIISKFLRSTDKDEKSMYRERIIPAYWNMLLSLVGNFFDSLTGEKQALFRYALFNPSFIDETQKNILRKINAKKTTSENGYFIDEWLLKIGNGNIRPSSVDETKKAGKKSPSALQGKLERKTGARDAEIASLRQKIEQHLMIEQSMKSSISIITSHEERPGFNGLLAPYTQEQKKAIVQLQDILKTLLKSDRNIESSFNTLKSLDGDIQSLKTQGGELKVEIDVKTVAEEFSTLRQMTKMTVGRQGNHFPFLFKTYMPKSDLDICTKENLEQVLRYIEKADPGVFIRTYKQEEHRIVPHFIIVPSYGDFGICWEPFERVNKATSKGRIAVPLYPKNLKTAILYALGDLRWQIAKEKALHYWMEEGLTGYYYNYAQKTKLKGDLKESFIQDYILWIEFESQGMQKLNKEVRSIFWRYIPFPQEIKEVLKNRGYYYAELFKKDQNRAMSRGY
jgi:hypothetical protein